MNVQLPVQMDKAAFLAWAEGREERYELVEGRVVMMVNASRAHARIIKNLSRLLDRQLDARQWEVITEFGVDAGPRTLRFPDVMVDRMDANLVDRTAVAPVLLIEVLSPSTTKYDLGDKLSEFLKLPTLQGYFVFAQDEKKAWAWVRGAQGFPPGPHIFEGDTAIIPFPALDLDVPLADVYANVTLD
jgi:Uma2 family endonuclease